MNRKAKMLVVSDALSLPSAYATSRNMVLSQSGAGKSNVCVVLAEEMYRIGVPWVAIDTKGDWYGVRSNRTGKQRGLDVPVFGGEFGDLPLSPLAGVRMAELVAAGKFAGVLDVSDFPKASDVSKFLVDFATTLLKKQRTPVHLFLEECADYLPQGGYRGQMDPMASACVGAMKRLATKGRFRGIGYTVVSQRPAEVNKTVLYQCETLIALRMVGDLDIKWIEGWVKRSSKRSPELLSTLHELENGEGWVWSPGKLKIIERVKFRRRETFDSGAEPEIGKARFVPKMAPVELKALRQELADLEEQAKADDPKLLRARILELEKQLKAKVPSPAPAASPITVKSAKIGRYEIVVDRRHLEETIAASDTIERAMAELDKALTGARSSVNVSARVLRRARATGPSAMAKQLKKAGPAPAPAPAEGFEKRFKGSPGRNGRPRPLPAPAKPAGPTNGAERHPDIGKGGLLRIMVALAQVAPVGLLRRNLALRAGMAQSGTFDTYLSRGTTAGWIETSGDSMKRITIEGIAALGHFDPLPTGDALFQYWLNEVGSTNGKGAILRALQEAYPNALTRNELASSAGLGLSGTFDTYLSKLRGLELVEGKGEIKLSEELVG